MIPNYTIGKFSADFRTERGPYAATNFKLIQKFLEYYPNQEYGSYYLKNFFNENNSQLIVFKESGYVVAEIDEKYNVTFEEHITKLVSKKIKLARYDMQNHELEMAFDDSSVLHLESLNDSEEDWSKTYSAALIGFYKELYTTS